MKRESRLRVGAALVFLAISGILWHSLHEAGPQIPQCFADDLPDECRQVILVLSPHETSIETQLWLMERAPDDRWRAGLAWGVGEHRASPPEGFRIKREGDGCSPAGIFRLPFAFGIPPDEEATWLRLPYIHLTQDIIGVDDPKSRHYNQVLDATTVERDWDSDERMNRHRKVYRWGAFIAHNPDSVPGLGSCIFLHLWPGPGRSTAGCTAMSGDDIVRVLGWLDPALEPRIVQALGSW